MAAVIGCAACAAGNVQAQRDGGAILVTWDASGCAQDECTLTAYRNGWPCAVICVYAPAGQYEIPAALVSKAGKYTVRLKCGDACELVTVRESASEPPTVEPTAEPTAKPTPAPTIAPTAKPTIAPTAKPTIAPTAKPTIAPTVKPTATPTIAPTAKPTKAPVNGTTLNDMAREVIALVNEYRAENGLNALTESAQLTQAACVRASEIVEKFSHTRPNGEMWHTVSTLASGENIAMGYAQSESVMAAWMNSEGHRANILREGFKTIGVCAYSVNGTVYWAQLFGR